MNILSCAHLRVDYDDTVLTDISFSVEKGDFICIVGENGSGKTTLLKALLGLVPTKGGKVTVKEGVKIGYVPQKLSARQNFPASVEEIVRMGIRTRRPFLARREKIQVTESMQLLGIDSIRKKAFSDLSGGQQQRVLIARALAGSGDILILDEPTVGLDPHALSDLYRVLAFLNREKGITILMVSHDIDAAVKVSNKLMHIHKTVQYFGPPHDFICSECGKRFLGGDKNA